MRFSCAQLPGEVVAGTEERLAAGDAVNVAARLQQAAEPDEVLLGGKMAQDLDYIPMPDGVVKQIEAAWKQDVKDDSGKPIF